MGFRSQFRDVKEWLDTTNGTIKLETTSDTAAKLYDASLSQLCGWYQDESLGGLDTTLASMLEADPNFKLGRIFELELNLMGAFSSPRFNQDFDKKLEQFKSEVAGNNLKTRQEELHFDVVLEWAKGDIKSATKKLEKLISFYPEDLLALKMLQEMYFMLGTALPMRN